MQERFTILIHFVFLIGVIKLIFLSFICSFVLISIHFIVLCETYIDSASQRAYYCLSHIFLMQQALLL